MALIGHIRPNWNSGKQTSFNQRIHWISNMSDTCCVYSTTFSPTLTFPESLGSSQKPCFSDAIVAQPLLEINRSSAHPAVLLLTATGGSGLLRLTCVHRESQLWANGSRQGQSSSRSHPSDLTSPHAYRLNYTPSDGLVSDQVELLQMNTITPRSHRGVILSSRSSHLTSQSGPLISVAPCG